MMECLAESMGLVYYQLQDHYHHQLHILVNVLN